MDNSKVVRCSKYVTVGRINVTLGWELFEKLDYLKYLRSYLTEIERIEKDVVRVQVRGTWLRGVSSTFIPDQQTLKNE